MFNLSNIKVSKQFVNISIFIFLINAVLEIYYITFLSDNFNYLGFKLSFNFLKYLESNILFILFIILSWQLFNKSRFLYSIYILLLLFFFIPNSILYAFMNHIRGPLYSVSLLLILFLMISPIRIHIKTIYLNINFKYILMFSIALLLLYPIILNFGFNFNLNTLLLKDIYSTRETFTTHSTKLIDYVYNWEVKTIIPVMFVFFLISRKYILAILAFLILLYLYVISGNKTVYITTAVVVFFYYTGHDYVLKSKFFLYLILLALIIIPIIDVFILNDFLLRGTFVMRTLFFPALLNYCYFDFFANNPLYFSENFIFNQFFHSPLQIKSAYLISKVYFHTDKMYANNGIISDGFMNFGYWGVFILSLLFSLIFMFFNSIDIDKRYFGIFFIYVFFFLSAPMFTIFLTGGLWLLFIFALTIMKKQSVQLSNK